MLCCQSHRAVVAVEDLALGVAGEKWRWYAPPMSLNGLVSDHLRWQSAAQSTAERVQLFTEFLAIIN